MEEAGVGRSRRAGGVLDDRGGLEGGAAGQGQEEEVRELPADKGKGAGSSHVPATRPKAKATPPLRDDDERVEEHEHGAEENARNEEAEESRTILVARLAALEQRETELQEGDPRREKLLQRIDETKGLVKRAGGRTFQRLIYNILGSRKGMEVKARAIEEAERQLEDARQRAARAREEEAQAAQRVQRCNGQMDEEKARYASLAFQAAIEASVGVEGYSELAQALGNIGCALELAGAHNVEGSFARVAGFIYQFAPKEYSKGSDPAVQEFASEEEKSSSSSSSNSDGTIPVDWFEQEAAAERDALQRASPPPRAFETSIATEVSVKFARSVEDAEKMPLAWQKGNQKVPLLELRMAGGAKAERQGGGKDERAAAEGRVRTGKRVARSVDEAGGRRQGKSRSRGRGCGRSLPRSDGGGAEHEGSQGGSMDWRGEVRGTKRGRSREPQRRKGSSEDEVDGAAEQAHEHCLACGDGPLIPSLLRERCSCGGPICGQRTGASSCVRCNGDRSQLQVQVLG